MKKILITLDDNLAKELAKERNMSEAVRNALKVYNNDISTDTLAGIRDSYKGLQKYMEEKHEYYDQVFARLDKLISVLETRM